MDTKISTGTQTSSSKIRERLDHPVVDADGHILEFFPVFFDYLRQVAGPEITGRMQESFGKTGNRRWYQVDDAERRRYNMMRPTFWQAPVENKTDRATAMLPRLMYERLPEMGIDFAVVYPTIGFLLPDLPEDEIRQAACRAHNVMMKEMFAGCEDRLAPVAVIPCHSPGEALAELDFTLGELGYKIPLFGTLVRRPIEIVAEHDAELGRIAFWTDTLAIDSPYDYDPVWQKCMDYKVPATAHASSQGIGMRRSVSNYMYNQTGHFADAGHAFAKALFFGGVTNRFPDLNFAFLECGVAWGAGLLCDLVERWEKRNKQAIQQFNPAKMDNAYMAEMFDRYGGKVLSGKLDPAQAIVRDQETPDTIDDFAATGISKIEDLYDRFVPNFYFGCEADDRMTGTAFDSNVLPFGAKLRAMFSSDIGHWDVPHMSNVLAEAYELVEDKILTEDDFRDFVFTNPVELFTNMDPNFFDGTAIEADVKTFLAGKN